MLVNVDGTYDFVDLGATPTRRADQGDDDATAEHEYQQNRELPVVIPLGDDFLGRG